MKSKKAGRLSCAVLAGMLTLCGVAAFRLPAKAEAAEPEYVVVNDDTGEMAGIALTDGMDGSLYVGAKSQEQVASEGRSFMEGRVYAVTEFKLQDFVMDYENGGLLIKLQTFSDAFVTAVYVMRDNYGYMRFASTSGYSGSHTVVCDDRTLETVGISSTNSRATFPAETMGTWNLPWREMYVNNAGDFQNSEALRVMIFTAVSEEYCKPGDGVLIGNIATYSVSESGVQVVTGADMSELSVSFDGTEADIDVTTPHNGKMVYNTKQFDYTNGISINNYTDDQGTVNLIEYGIYSVLPENTTENGIGYTLGDGELLFSGDRYVRKADTVVEEIEFSIEAMGAGIRLSDPSGLRFGWQINGADYARLQTFSNVDIGFGTVWLPSDLLKGELTPETENALVIPMEIFFDRENLQFTGALVGMTNAAQYERKITARPYLRIDREGETRFFCFGAAERSISEVAVEARADTAFFESLSEAQKALIESFIV